MNLESVRPDIETGAVDHSSPVPLFLQIEQDLRRRILSGQLENGVQLPRETELAERYGASRVTVRRALEALSEAGLIQRTHGVGTIVTAPLLPINCQLDLSSTFGEQLRLQGYTPQVVVLQRAVAKPPESARKELEMSASQTAVMIRRLTSVGGRPMVLNTSWLPSKLVPGLQKRPLVDDSLWRTIAANYSIRTRHSRSQLELATASSDEARHLLLDDGAPVLQLTALNFESEGRPFEHSTMLWSGNMKFNFRSKIGPGPEEAA